MTAMKHIISHEADFLEHWSVNGAILFIRNATSLFVWKSHLTLTWWPQILRYFE